jgi:hypothetical protein
MSKDTPDLYWALAYIRLHQNEDVRTQALALCDEIADRVTEARMSARAQAFEEAARRCEDGVWLSENEGKIAVACARQIRALATSPKSR